MAVTSFFESQGIRRSKPTEGDIFRLTQRINQRNRQSRVQAATNVEEDVADIEVLFDPETGLPNRLPNSPREAQLFQLQGARSAAKLQRQAVNAALSTLRFGFGQTQRASPFSLAAATSPLLSQMAQIQAGQQFQSPDFSFFQRPQTGAALQQPGAQFGGFGGIGIQTPSPIGLQFTPEPTIPFGPPPQTFQQGIDAAGQAAFDVPGPTLKGAGAGVTGAARTSAGSIGGSLLGFNIKGF